MSSAEKIKLDLCFIRAVISTNLAFHVVENQEFVTLFKELRPGYVLPSRKQLAGALLHQLYNEVQCDVKKLLEVKPFVTLTMDHRRMEKAKALDLESLLCSCYISCNLRHGDTLKVPRKCFIVNSLGN